MEARKRVIDVQILGVEAAQRQLFRGAAAAGDMEPALDEVADDMMRIVEINFTSQGHRGGGSWKVLTPRWIARKAKKGLDPRILFANHHLYKSMTERGDPGMDLEIDDHHVHLSSQVEYAEAHNWGNDHVPARPFAYFLPQDRDRWVKICESHLIRAMQP